MEGLASGAGYVLQRSLVQWGVECRIEVLALTPRYKPLVDRLCCFRGFKTQVAVTAIAREMVGFLWAVLRDVDVSKLQEVSTAA